MNTLTIQTTSTNRIIKQSLQALIKSKAISSGYKIPYIKHYTSNEKGFLTVENVQIIVLFTTTNRDKSGHAILDNILKTRQTSNICITDTA